ncbi:glutamate--tRNA ligase [Nanoarchaeota archaeon]
MEKTIRKYALQNAIRFDGKANPGNIIGKVIGDNPKLKDKMKDVVKDIQGIVKEVNSMSVEEQTKELKKLAPELLEEKKVEKKDLKELPNAKKGKVVMRFEPSPSGALHIGHACVLNLNSEYCKRYDGKLILRISDTNPENIYEPVYELIPENANWLTGNNVSEVVFQSSRLGTYYDAAEKLIDMGKAYVCRCDPEEFRKLIFKKKACKCRSNSIEENHQLYDRMFSDLKPGEAVIRIKTDIDHPNPALRDWPAMRINLHEHPKTGTEHRVWPLMNLAVAVDDHEMGVTHTIRAKDHIDNERKQSYVFDYMGWKMPEHVYVGRINFEDMAVSSSETRKLIDYKKFEGWDDIRLPFLPALKRRGYRPEAFLKYTIDGGVTQNDKTVSKEEYFKSLNHFNKEVIEPKAYRYFFIKDPVKIKVEGAQEQLVELDLHPDNKKGGRKFKTSEEFYIEKEDLKEFKDGELIRLMDCLNFIKQKNKFVFDSIDYTKFKEEGKKIIHWLPVNETIKVSLLMEDNKLVNGIAEKGVDKIKTDSVVQFERLGFCRCDSKSKFWFGHR